MWIRSVRIKNIKAFAEDTTLQFTRGVNLIHGPNGAGKSTLIEAIGLAIFGYDPVQGRRLKLTTYLLRDSGTVGEIEVALTVGNETYHVLRRYAKAASLPVRVWRQDDQFIEAETEEEFQTFIAALFQLKRFSQIPELFEKLIGIKQGHLTHPFDLRPSEAVRYFHPLFDVEMYLEKSKELLPVTQQIQENVRTTEQALAQLRGELVAVNDAPSALARLQSDEKVQAQKLETLLIRQSHLEEGLKAEQEVIRAQQALIEAHLHLRARQRAQEVVLEYGNQAKRYLNHGKELDQLAEMLTFKQQLGARQLDAGARLAKIKQLAIQYRERSLSANEQLLTFEKEIQSTREERLSLRKPDLTAYRQLKGHRQELSILEQELAKLKAEDAQVAALKTGLCPLLKEPCRQFATSRTFQDSEKLAIGQQKLKAMKQVEQDLERRSERELKQLTEVETLLEAKETQLIVLEEKKKALKQLKIKADKEILVLSDQEQETEETIQALVSELAPLNDLEQRLTILQKTQEELRPFYDRVVKAEAFLEEATAPPLTELEKALQTAWAALRQLSHAPFSQQDYNDLMEDIGKARATKEHLKLEIEKASQMCLERERISKRFGEEQASLNYWSYLQKKVDLSRKILKESAPLIAETLCLAVAEKANKTFNHLNHEPAEVIFDSHNYALRVVTSSGEKHFTMLSGGEQTKLALATTLAMIHQFSNLQFCIFDEPTYGIDEESRSKLIEEILDASTHFGLKQLILVSHDELFHQYTEHTVSL